ncbi:zinc finger protein 280C isoform X3 [Cebus imitator]|uniref:Zinc finger protein 280C n=1 Tax=Cebus imitator TaxID=2715852 RepID=A0A2K5Q8I6_CEBIM|nr:zinc finger protein 280C isoform X3 [Cebus imitator]XP_037586963.1 zinc finger protein 280C isoform X3 [Cebus imitator]
MDDDKTFQPKNIPKMTELFMECEEEELEPWQKKVEKTQDEDDDELIFVGEILSSKPAISNILNRGHSSSSSKRIKSEPVSPGIPEIFRTASQRYRDPSSNAVAALPRFHPESESSQSSVTVENESKPDFTKNSQVESDNSSVLLFDSTQESLPPSQDIPAIFREGMKNASYVLKRPSTSKVNSVTPKKPKTSEDVPEINPSTSLPLTDSPPVTSSHVRLAKGTNTSSPYDAEAHYLRACPKCNVQFNLLDPLKYHMKHCCPNMITKFLGAIIKSERPYAEDKNEIDPETGKLIMLVNEFYYGRHEGVTEKEPKTYTTFKCFSCSKVLKNNIRFMNHMKHHLELEKQNNESWENHTTCQHCYRQYPTPFQLQCHIESTHTPHEFSTICKICELSFETEHILLQHMKDTHKPGEMPYVCQVCQFRSSTFSDVEAHFRAAHENTKNLLCPFCLKVSKMATPYMNHYMKHQKKGVHRCPKCRLQFLTSKEKAEHKAQHRTFIKPKELEGLPPGTKVTIRASLGPHQSKLPTAPSGYTPGTSFLQVTPPTSQNSTAENPRKSNASKSKTSRPHATTSTASKANTSKPRGRTAKCKAKPSYKQKRQRNRKNKMTLALKNLRCRRGIHKCIECHSKIKDFASHFSIYIHCSFCKYNTNCNKAFVNHMMSSHSNHPSKQFCIFKKHSGTLSGITLVCLKCDFLADSSGLDRMAKHLSQRKTHTCQVIIENVSKSTSTSEPTSDCPLK